MVVTVVGQTVWIPLVVCVVLGVVACSGGGSDGSLKVATHTLYSSATEARISGRVAVDSAGCVMLQTPQGRSHYRAFPRKFVSTTSNTVTFDGHVYRVGDEMAVAGGGPADHTDGLEIPSGCPLSGLVFISPPNL